jgi:hypothetical protein
MNEEGQRLCTGGSLVEIGALATKGIGGNDGLRVKPIIANRADQFDLSERSQYPLSPYPSRAGYRKSRAKTSVPLVGPDRGGYLAARFDLPPTIPPALPALMLINLLPDFFEVLDAGDRVFAYQQYFSSHRRILEPYWHNYVLDPEGPHFLDVVRSTVHADRTDLRTMLDRTDVEALARSTEKQCAELLASDVEIDVVLMVGVGAANAGELVADYRGTAFVCLEHFTSTQNPDTRGLGLDPELIPLWLAHEIAHCIRYTSPTSRSEMKTLIDDANGYYSYWETGRRATLRELVLNEGLAVEAARAVSPGHAEWEYFGYGRRQYARVREMEPLLIRAISEDLDHSGLGLRLKFLSAGMSDSARAIDERHVVPERAGYYLGARMVEPAINSRGFPWAIRANATELGEWARSAIASA